jgi:hypothetical protein
VKRFRWRIDEMEGDVASVEVDGRLVDVPRAILPAGAREDWILAVEVDAAADGASTVRIAYDRAATEAALARSREQLRRIPKQDDPGGDIHL